MKLIDFYLAAFLPILAIGTLALLNFGSIIPLSIIAYYFYRCFLDYHKLRKQGIVGKKDIWKFIVPGHTYFYFREIYFKQ